jgi:hypothetical protein
LKGDVAISAIKKKLSRSNGSSKHSNGKPPRPKNSARNGSAPDDKSATAATARGGFDSPWLGALPHRWRAQRPE